MSCQRVLQLLIFFFQIAIFHQNFAISNATTYHFILRTIQTYSNTDIATNKEELETNITNSFINTISTAFHLSPFQFDIDLSVFNYTILEIDDGDDDDINNEYEDYQFFYINSTILNQDINGNETNTSIIFETYEEIDNFNEYIYYGFLERYYKLSLNSISNDQLILLNIEWIEMDESIICIKETKEPYSEKEENWEKVTNELFSSIYEFLRWIFVGILTICSIIVIIGYIHSWIVWNYDIQIGYAIFFCFAMFDWYSDILFTFTIPVQYIEIWLISFCLLLFPLIGNVGWLVSQQKIWEQDAAIGAKIKAWLIRWRPFLFSLTIISGSSFGGINMCNSNMLGYPLFRMGLRNVHLEKFDSKRLFLTVLGENIPQLILQGYYWYVSGFSLGSTDFYDENQLTLGLAMISGILSIIYAFGIICSGKMTLARFNDSEEELFEISILCTNDFPNMDNRKNLSYKYKLYPLRKAFASLLAVDLACVELHPPTKIKYGYQLRFTLNVKELGGNKQALEQLEELVGNKEMPDMIKNTWNLSTLPQLKNLNWKKNRKRDYQENMVLLQVESNLKPIQKKKSYDNETYEMSYSKTYSKKLKQFKLDSTQNNIIPSNTSNENHNISNDKLPWSNIPSYSGVVHSPKPSPNHHHNKHHHDRSGTTVIHNNNNNNYNHSPIQSNVHNMVQHDGHYRVFSESNNGGQGSNIPDLVVGDRYHAQNISLFANRSEQTENNIRPHIEYDDNDDGDDLELKQEQEHKQEYKQEKEHEADNMESQRKINNGNKRNNVEMISNPSKKNTMASASTMSKNMSYASSKNSKKGTFAYNYDQNIHNNNNNGKLIDIEDGDIEYNDAILLGNDLNEKNNIRDDDDIRSQAMSIASTNSEALFQQQLYNHIKGENNFKTIL